MENSNENRDVLTLIDVQQIFQELSRAQSIFPNWPDDPLHALAILGEEYGELTKSVLQTIYEPQKANTGDIRLEAIQMAAMALRFLLSLDHYVYKKSVHHESTHRIDLNFKTA